MSRDANNASIKIKGMTCAACAARLQKAVEKMPGVQEANVNFATEKLSVTYDSGKADIDGFIKRIRA